MPLPGVQLGGAQDLQLVQQLLDQAVEQQLQNEAVGATEEMRQALAVLSGNVVNMLRQCVTLAGEAPPKSPLSALKSPLLKPLSPPPVDDEVRALERQLDEASQRVAQLRASMQSRLADRLAEQLAAARPKPVEGPATAADGTAAEGSGAPGTEGGASPAAFAAAEGKEAGPAVPLLPACLSPQTQELQERLAAAASKMPSLRARLEEASGRLQRVMGVAQGVLDGPPPNTVEKAVMGKTPGKTPGPAQAVALQRDMQPLPCAALAPDATAGPQ